MKIEQLKEMIREELQAALDEKSVPEPYDRKNKREMSQGQIARRDKIGKGMEKSKKTVSSFKDQYGKEWRDYLWATATSKAIKSGE